MSNGSPATAPTARTAKVVHVSEMISQGGREGKVESIAAQLSLQLGETGHDESLTPELLFAGAYASCFHGALLNAAARGHHDVIGTTVIARVSLREDDRGGYNLGVELRASIPGISRADAERLLHQAHQTCPYSKATRGNIEVTLALD